MKFIKAIFIAAILATTGCTTGLEKLHTEMAEKGVAPMGRPEIQALFSDATLREKGKGYQYVGYYTADGKMNSKAWGSWGEEFDDGSWQVNEDGLYCSEWTGPWAKGLRCFETYPGEGENEYIQALVTGQKSKSTPSGIYHNTITPGDTSGL